MTVQQSNNSTTRPLVSVIMNCLNGEKYLKEAIDSVYAQTFENWEIVFWDNASSDGSAEIARSYDHRLRYFRGEETIPLYAARNKALEQAGGGFIGFLDCDDLWMPEKLRKQMPLFDDPGVGLVFSDAIYFNKKGRSKRLYASRPYCIGRCFRKLLSDYFLCLPTVMIRGTALAKPEQCFDPRLNIVGDADLFGRISYEWKLSMVNEPLASYRVDSSSFGLTKLQLCIKELPLMLTKYREVIPDFERQFPKEIVAFKTRISIIRAMAFVDLGDRTKAWSCLSPYLFSSGKAFGLFTLSFFPKVLFDFALTFRNRASPR